jgi:hypothetical protein
MHEIDTLEIVIQTQYLLSRQNRELNADIELTTL